MNLLMYFDKFILHKTEKTIKLADSQKARSQMKIIACLLIENLPETYILLCANEH